MHPDAVRYDNVRMRTAKVVADAEDRYGVKISPLTINFNLRGRVAGYAQCEQCQRTGRKLFEVKFNKTLITGKHYQDILDETVPHEVAHLVCQANPSLGRGHNSGWKRICVELGGNGKTRHSYDTIKPGTGWDYITTLGIRVTVNGRQHRLIQTAGKSYKYKDGRGSIDKTRPFCQQGGSMGSSGKPHLPAPVSKPVPVTPTSDEIPSLESWLSPEQMAILSDHTLDK